MTNETLYNLKREQLKLLSEYREQLYKNPVLKYLFLQLTLRCNEHCLHCGSNCGDVPSVEMSLEQYKEILNQVAGDFDLKSFLLMRESMQPAS